MSLTCQHLIRKVTSCFTWQVFILLFSVCLLRLIMISHISLYFVHLFYSCSTCSWESPGCSTVALVQWFMNLSRPLLCWVEVKRQAVALRVHVHLTTRDKMRKRQRDSYYRPAALKSTELNRCCTLTEQPSLRRRWCFSVKTIIIISDSSKTLSKDLELNRGDNRSGNIKLQQWLSVVSDSVE